MCKRHVETSQSTNVTVIILRCRTHSRLGRKSGYFKRWLEYSNEFEALKASEKLNIVLLSWERTCWTTLIQSCDEKRRCGRCSCWTLSSGTENWLNQRHLETPQTMPVYCFKESFISWTNWIKRKLNSMQSKELFACSSGRSTLQRGKRYSKKQNIHLPKNVRGTQREYNTKPLKHSIVKCILVFKR